jgi:hypothetical protein
MFLPSLPTVNTELRPGGLFWVLVPLTEEQVYGPTFMPEFTALCRKTTPLAEYTTKALGLDVDSATVRSSAAHTTGVTY